MALVLAAAQAPAQTLRGDFNGNGELDAQDITIIAQAILENRQTTADNDLNRDGRLDVADLALLRRVMAEGVWPDYTVSTPSKAPSWVTDYSFNEARPDWTEPDNGSFENWSILCIDLEEGLQPSASDDDLLAVFVGDELRGLACPAVPLVSTGQDAETFLVKVWGNEGNDEPVELTVKYYSSKLQHIFTLSAVTTMGEMLGINDDYVLPFTAGQHKYTVEETLDVNKILAGYGIEPGAGDMVAAFVVSECRGVGKMADSTFSPLKVRGHQAGEPVALRYYDAAKGQIITFTTTFVP